MNRLKKLNFNDPAPDLEAPSAEGQVVHLSGLWAGQTLVLAFIRHFGCPQCKEMLEELRGLKPAFESSGMRLVAVTQGLPDEAREFGERHIPGVLCLSDSQHELYRAYGIAHAGLRQTYLSLAVWRANSRASRKGYLVELPPPGQDAMLMSALFIIGTDGRVRLPYYYDHIADHPPVALLLKGFLGMTWDRPLEGAIEPGKE
jgi:peroxiredoxin